MKGYQLIDLDSFEELTTHADDSMIILMLTWLIELVREKHDLSDIGEIEVILSMHNGNHYPVIGVKYFSDDIDEITDIEPIIQEECERMLKENNVESLLDFLQKNFKKVSLNTNRISEVKNKAE